MHDPRHLLDPTTDAVRKLARRGYSLDVDQLSQLSATRSSTIQAADSARADPAAEFGTRRRDRSDRRVRG
jgi:seryl-tRNA synthetase